MTTKSEEFITVRIFVLPTELVVARAKLESEGIETYVQDELTIQTDNFLSHAVGGVKLQVRTHDAERADRILEEGGFTKGKPAESSAIELKLQSPEFRKKITRWLIISFALIIIVSLSIISYQKATLDYHDLLVDNSWCFHSMKHEEKKLSPYTLGILRLHPNMFLATEPSCNEAVIFYDDYKGSFPGFDSFSTGIKWEVSESTLTLFSDSKKMKSEFQLYEEYLEELKTEKNISDSLIEVMKADYKEALPDPIKTEKVLNSFEKLLPLKLEMKFEKHQLHLTSNKTHIVLNSRY